MTCQMVRPSCPALVVHDDDAFRKTLIATLDQHHFMVTFTTDGHEAVDLLDKRDFRVVFVGVNLSNKNGTRTLDYLRDANDKRRSFAVIILGDPDPRIRAYAPWADETMLKPVDAEYVVARALSYCERA